MITKQMFMGLFVALVSTVATAEVRVSEYDSQNGQPRYLNYCGGTVEVNCGRYDRQCRVDFRSVRECKGVKLYTNDKFTDISNTYRTTLQGSQGYYSGTFFVDYTKIGGRSSGDKYLNVYLYHTGRSEPYEKIRIDLPDNIRRDSRGYITGGGYDDYNDRYNDRYDDRYDNRRGSCDRWDYDYPYCR